jgi:hypothetical protein
LHEKDEGHYKDRGVKNASVLIALAKIILLWMPGFRHDILVKRISGSQPFITLGAGKRSFVGEAKTFTRHYTTKDVIQSPYLGQLRPCTMGMGIKMT